MASPTAQSAAHRDLRHRRWWRAWCWCRSATPACRSGRRASRTRRTSPTQAGSSPGNDVNVSGIKVGKVTGVELAGDAAKVTFTVDRDIRVGDQSLVAIKTDTVLGEKSLAVTPQGAASRRSSRWAAPRLRTRSTPRCRISARTPASWTSRSSSRRCRRSPTRCATPPRSCAARSTASPNLSRSLNKRDEALEQLLAHAKKVSDTLGAARRSGQPADHRRQPAVRRAR